MKNHIAIALSLVCTAACTPEADLAITNARIIAGDGNVIDNGSVVIVDGRIASVASGEPTVSAAAVIDAAGKTILPGFFDTHMHLFGYQSIRDQQSLEEWAQNDVDETLNTIVANGITTINDPGDFFPAIVTIADRAAAGETIAPRIRYVGPAFTATGGHPASTVCADSELCATLAAAQVDTPEQARAKVSEVAASDAIAIKLIYGPSPRGIPVMSGEVLAAITDRQKRTVCRFMATSRLPLPYSRPWNLGSTASCIRPGLESSITLKTWRAYRSCQHWACMQDTSGRMAHS